MGQVGSVEQQEAVKAVLLLQKNPNNIAKVLEEFCLVFPEVIEEDTSKDPLDMKEKKLLDVVHSLLEIQVKKGDVEHNEAIYLLLQSFKRIAKWKELYRIIPKYSLGSILQCTFMQPGIAIEALYVLKLIISRSWGPLESEKFDKWEMSNKQNFNTCEGFKTLCHLVDKYHLHTDSKTNRILELIVDILNSVIVSKKYTTDDISAKECIKNIVDHRIQFMELCRHPDQTIQLSYCFILHSVTLQCNKEQVTKIQDCAREHGCLLWMIRESLKQISSESQGYDQLQELRHVSMDLVELFCAGNMTSKSVMGKIFPVDLLVPIEYKAKVVSQQALNALRKSRKSAVALPSFSFDLEAKIDNAKKRFSQVPKSENESIDWLVSARSQGDRWQAVLKAVLEVHENPKLIWRDKTLEELRSAISKEIEALDEKKKLDEDRSTVSWNSSYFLVLYPSMRRELFVGGYFIEYLLPRISDLDDLYEMEDPASLAWHLYDHLFVEKSQKRRILCIATIRFLLRRYAMVFNGNMPIRYMFHMLSERGKSCVFYEQLLLLIATAVKMSRGASLVNEVIDIGGMNTLLRVICLSLQHDGPYLGDDNEDFSYTIPYDQDGDETSEESSFIIVGGELERITRAGVTVLVEILRRSLYLRKSLCTMDKLRPLVQMLIQHPISQPTIELIVFSLLMIVKADPEPEVKSALFRSGIFIFLLKTSSTEGCVMSTATAEFLSEFHSKKGLKGLRSSKENPEKSHLCHLLPKSMVSLLNEKRPTDFATVFNSDVTNADIVWNFKRRNYLLKKLDEELSDYLRSEGPPHPYVYKEVGIINYEQFDKELEVGGLFLTPFVELDGEFVLTWTSVKFEKLLVDLFDYFKHLLRRKSTFGSQCDAEDENDLDDPLNAQILVLKALLKLIQNNQGLVLPPNSIGLLLTPLKRTLLSKKDQIRGVLSLEILLLIIGKIGPIHEKNQQILRDSMYGNENGINSVLHALSSSNADAYVELISKDHPNNFSKSLVFRLLDFISTIVQMDEGIAAITNYPVILTYLLKHCTMKRVKESSLEVPYTSLQCLFNLSNIPALQRLLLNSGFIIHLLDLCAFCPPGDPFDSLINLAIDIIRIFLRSAECSSITTAILDQLLTPNLKSILLESNEKFNSIIHSKRDIKASRVCWTTSMKENLHDSISSELSKINLENSQCWVKWDPEDFIAADSFRFQYPELSEEIIVGGVYLKYFIESNGSNSDDVDWPSFHEALIVSIKSNEQVIQSLTQIHDKALLKKKEILRILRQALDIVQKIRPELNQDMNTSSIQESMPAVELDDDDSNTV